MIALVLRYLPHILAITAVVIAVHTVRTIVNERNSLRISVALKDNDIIMLKQAVARQTASIQEFKTAGEIKLKASEIKLQAAVKERLRYQRTAQELLATKPTSEDSCISANELINSQL